MRKFCIGDIHGNYRALRQVLRRSGFDYEKDQLISLGDIADGWHEVPECVEELMKIKNLIITQGNHDTWMLEWMETGKAPDIWMYQGGKHTKDAYEIFHQDKVEPHFEFLVNKFVDYYLDTKNRLFVHAGIDPSLPVQQQSFKVLSWDRELHNAAVITGTDEEKICKLYDTIYIGHTAGPWNEYPMLAGGVWLMDSGAGWDGVLSMVNIETEQIFKSDRTFKLYGRNNPRNIAGLFEKKLEEKMNKFFTTRGLNSSD